MLVSPTWAFATGALSHRHGSPCVVGRYSVRRTKLLFEYSVLLQTISGHVSLEKLIGKTISAFLARTFKGVAFMMRSP
jgi:hypothetical protein